MLTKEHIESLMNRTISDIMEMFDRGHYTHADLEFYFTMWLGLKETWEKVTPTQEETDG